MTVTRQTEKWITAGLGVVALLLVVNLVFRGGSRTNAAKPATPARPTPAAAQGQRPAATVEELARYDPAIRLGKFKEIQERPIAKLKRNPFEFVVREVAAAPSTTVEGPAPPPPPPAPPPPPPLKAVGYSVIRGGAGEAFVTLQDELFVVHEGETFGKRFRVTKLSPTAVEIFDETTQQTIRLPIGG